MVSENTFLLHALLMGIFITFIYDLIRIFRRVIPHNGLGISIEDLLFWIYCGAEVFLLMYHEGNGNLRWFAVGGAFLGMYLYKRLVSDWLVKYCTLVLQFLLDRLLGLLRLVFRPLYRGARFLRKQTRAVTGKVSGGGRRALRRLKKKLTFFLKVLRMNL